MIVICFINFIKRCFLTIASFLFFYILKNLTNVLKGVKMDVNQIAFIILLSFGVLAFLYLLGCENEENEILNDYHDRE